MKHLNVSYNDLAGDGVIAICSALYGHKKLRSVRMYNTQLNDEGCAALAKLLETTEITELFLNNNLVTDKGLSLILDVLKTNEHLRVLVISQNQIMLRDLGNCLAVQQSIREIFASDVHITSEALAGICTGLQQNRFSSKSIF